MTGTVYLVGAGPGAPDLLTLRAADLLRRADIVFYDALVHPETLALAASAVTVAVGKRSGRLHTAQRFINKQLIDAAHKYAVVVRLKGGDPLLFGRAQEEIDALAEAGIAVDIVPGVSAAFAAGAVLRRSLTRRAVSRSVLFATPREAANSRENGWATAAAAADTLVLYMAAGQAEAVSAALLAHGVAAARPAVIVEDAASARCRIIPATVGGLPAAARQVGDGPAILMVGEVFADLAAADSLIPALAAQVRRA